MNEYYAIAVVQEKQKAELQFIQKKVVIHDDFFSAFTNNTPTEYWQSFPFPLFINLGYPQIAIRDITRVLSEVKALDPQKYINFHKGNPYYWLGFSYFLVKDYESAAYYMNAAVREDINRKPQKNYPSPATDFIELKSESNKQAAKELVTFTADKLSELIDLYNSHFQQSKNDTQYTIENVREWFLERATKHEELNYSPLATTFISFILEVDTRIEQIKLVENSPSKDALYLHLFKGCLLFESLLKENPLHKPKNSRSTLNSIITNLSNDLGLNRKIPTSVNSMREIITLIKNYDHTVDTAFEITAKIRNTTGHSLSWNVFLDPIIYTKIIQVISHCCLHTIFKLYYL